MHSVYFGTVALSQAMNTPPSSEFTAEYPTRACKVSKVFAGTPGVTVSVGGAAVMMTLGRMTWNVITVEVTEEKF